MAASSVAVPAKRRRRWPMVLFAMFVAFAALVWFAPTIVSKTGLKDSLIESATADVKGTVAVSSLSLGWLSPVEIHGLTVRDEAGNEIVRVERVVSSKSLFDLARNRRDLGRFAVESPAVHLVCTNDSTNLETAIAKYLETSDEPKPPRPTLSVTVTGGTATIVDERTKRVRTIEMLSAEVSIPAAASEPIAVNVSATTPDAKLPGSFKAEGTVGEGGLLTVAAKDVPLDVVGWFARRAEPGLTLSGTASGETRIRTVGESIAIDGASKISNLVAANDHRGGELLTSPEVTVEYDFGIRGSVFTSVITRVSSEAGDVSWKGSLDLSQPPQRWLETPGLDFEVKAEAAKLPGMLPRLRKVLDGTDVKSGEIDLRVQSAASPAGTTWAGHFGVSTLKAVRGGTPVVWDQPIRGEFAGRVGPDGLPLFDKLQVASDFIGLNFRGSWDRFEAAANIDLDRLSSHLNEFMDLGGAALAGRASVEAWNRPGATGAMSLALKANVERFAFSDGLGFSWTEPKLTLDVGATGKREETGALRLDRGTATLSAAGDSATFELTQLVPDLRTATAGAAKANVSGDLARWRTRLAGVVTMPAEWHLAGAVAASAAVRFSDSGATAEAIDVGLTNVQFRGAGTVINDPRVAAKLDSATWDRKTGAIQFRTGRLGSALAAAEFPVLSVRPDKNGRPILDGTISLTSARLNALAPILGLATDPRGGDAVDGMAKGTFAFRSTGEATEFDVSLGLEQFRYGPPQKPTWVEPKVDIAAKGKYDPAGDSLTLTTSRFAVDGLLATGKGTVNKVTTEQSLDLSGTLAYDLARVEPKIKEFLGHGGAISGKDTRPFRIAGSLANGPENLRVKVGGAGVQFPRLNGDASVGWHSVRAYGFDVGAADLKANVDKGIVAFEPVRASFGGGRVDVHPSLKLNAGAYDLSLAKGRLVDRAKLTPAACANALGFVLPAIANSTDAEGLISFDWDEGRIPLADYTKMAAKGQLIIHSVRVVPGPVVRELLAVTGVTETIFGLASEQTVQVWVENGRVYHKDFSIGAKNYTVKTSGSVGFDGTLQLTCEIPIPAKAIEQALKNYPRVKDAMAKRSVSVTLGGTVTNPTLDAKAFQANLQKMFADATKDAVGGLLQQELGKGLDKLLPKPPVKKP